MSAAAAAWLAWVASRSSGRATRRVRMPVRRTIQSSVTPIRGAISALGTTVSGRLTPTDAIAAPRGRTAATGSLRSGMVRLMPDTLSKDVAVANGHGAQTRHAGGRVAWP